MEEKPTQPSLMLSKYLGILLGRCHDLPPDAVHGLVALAFDRQLPHDVLRAEDGFQVEPGPLAQGPLLHHILCEV